MELKWITLKTVFLLLLASGSRRGEIHSLSSEVDHTADWKEVTFKPKPGFVSKTELRSKGASAFEGFTLRALSSVVGPDLPADRSLCPIRALKVYRSRTKELRGDRELLFLSYKPGHTTDIKKNTVSGWVQKLIKRAYKHPNAKACELCNYNTRDIRGMAASWASRGTFPWRVS